MTPAELPPDCLERYAPIRLLGKGGFGVVVEARDRSLARHVAIKVLSACSAESAEQRSRFADEARVIARLSSPHIVRVFDSGAADVPWIALELLTGPTLASLVARGPGLAPAIALEALEHLARALAVAHANGLVHRDVKPDNLIRGEDGRWRLTDFGIARWADSARVPTQAGIVLGTPAYIAPELWLGEPPSAASDLYAAGVTLHECLTGRPPFAHDSLTELAQLHLRARPPATGAGPAIDALVRSLLSKEPGARPASAKALLDALDACSEGSGKDEPPRPARSRARLALFGISCVAAAVALTSTRGRPPDVAGAPVSIAATPAPRAVAECQGYLERVRDRAARYEAIIQYRRAEPVPGEVVLIPANPDEFLPLLSSGLDELTRAVECLIETGADLEWFEAERWTEHLARHLGKLDRTELLRCARPLDRLERLAKRDHPGRAARLWALLTRSHVLRARGVPRSQAGDVEAIEGALAQLASADWSSSPAAPAITCWIATFRLRRLDLRARDVELFVPPPGARERLIALIDRELPQLVEDLRNLRPTSPSAAGTLRAILQMIVVAYKHTGGARRTRVGALAKTALERVPEFAALDPTEAEDLDRVRAELTARLAR